MPTTYNKLHRLKQLWTWEEFRAQYDSGPDIKTLKSNYLLPHHKPNKNTVAVVNKLYERHFPSPFPKAIDGLMDVYERLYLERDDRSACQAIEQLAQFIEYELRISDATEPMRVARLNWLLGDMAFDSIIDCRKANDMKGMLLARDRAVEFYNIAIVAIPDEAKLIATVSYKLYQNIVACYLNAARANNRFGEDDDLYRYVMASDFLNRTKEVLKLEPFNWNIARNGLRFASLLRQQSDVDYFFRSLCIANKRFMALDYAPYQMPAIQDSADFKWAIENVLTAEYLSKMEGSR